MTEIDRTGLARLGWTSDRNAEAASLPAARVAVEHRGYYDVLGLADDPFELTEGASVVASLRRSANSPLDFPAVGDWVSVRPGAAAGKSHAIEAVLARQSVFLRRSPGREPRPQVVGANINRVFVVTALDGDLNARRLERYLAVAWGGGAEAIVVLSKADKVADTDDALKLVRRVGTDVRIVVASLSDGRGIEELRDLVSPGLTVALVGSSGVGKSSIINTLLGEDVHAIGDTQRDGRGRHTTIRRHLLPTANGGFIIDTPGMREVQLWNDAGLPMVFGEIYEAAESCRFADCRHRAEPACAVRDAVASGLIDANRIEGLERLLDELEVLSEEITRRRRSRR